MTGTSLGGGILPARTQLAARRKAAAFLRRAPGLGADADAGRKGFTLVEVIVVLVILAILMAIAVPALTGYIDKAKDKKWEMRARDISLAVHSVLDEEYAKGNIDDTYVTNGEPGLASTNMKCWAAQKLTQDSSDSRATAATLLGEVYPGGGNPGNWGFNLIGPATAGSMPWNADGFYIDNRPVTGSSEWTYITYKVTPLVFASRAEFANALKNASYNASAGMYVYHVTE